MTLYNLIEELNINSVPCNCYHIGSYGNDDDKCCLVNVDGKWEVYIGERGKKRNLSVYPTEEKAFSDFLNRLLEHIGKR